MQSATVHQIKKELELLGPNRLLELCLRLAKFKKENKELLTYLIFEAADEEHFKSLIKEELEKQVKDAQKSNIYYTKKSLRKVLRYLDKVIRISGEKETETELRLYFISQIKLNRIPIHRSKVLSNLFEGQIKKIKTAMSKLHEDLQYDYEIELNEIIN